MGQSAQKPGKTKRWIWMGVCGVALLCITCQLLNDLCRPPERPFKIAELLIDATVFPPGWRAGTPGPPGSAPLGGQTSFERILLIFHTTAFGSNVGAVEEIHRYLNARDAAREFQRVLPIVLREGEHWSPWELPEGFRYQSRYADRIRIGCARETWEGVSVEYCAMVGQYEEYAVRFDTDIAPGYMTYADFERIVQAIDERMGRYLGKQPISPTP